MPGQVRFDVDDERHSRALGSWMTFPSFFTRSVYLIPVLVRALLTCGRGVRCLVPSSCGDTFDHIAAGAKVNWLRVVLKEGNNRKWYSLLGLQVGGLFWSGKFEWFGDGCYGWMDSRKFLQD